MNPGMLTMRTAIQTQFLLDLGNAAEQFRQMLHRQHLAFGLFVRLGRTAQPHLSIRDIVHNSGLCAHGDLVAQLEVPARPA